MHREVDAEYSGMTSVVQNPAFVVIVMTLELLQRRPPHVRYELFKIVRASLKSPGPSCS